MFLDYLAEKYSISFSPSKHDYYFSEHEIGENYFVLIKPSNYVNNSGFSAKQALSSYNLSIEDLLVVYDDVYLPIGTFRVKVSGGDGGHNGIASIIYHLFSEDIVRIRIGVGSKDFSQDQITDYVLSDFGKEDHKLLTEVFGSCSVLAESFITGGKKLLLDSNSKLVNPINNSDKNP
jgi:PTH1 family peptidyl-tRNA hydrolase